MYVRLSPALTVRNEKSCSFLQKVVTPDEENMEDFIVLPLPPYMGHILANIGKLPLDEAIDKISKDLHVSSDAVKNFIDQLTQNETHRKFKAAESAYLTLPPNMLVKSDSADSRTFTETTDFSPTDDFIQKRPSMPFSVNLMVTSKCTTDCMYCYAKRTIGPDLPTDKLFSIQLNILQQ